MKKLILSSLALFLIATMSGCTLIEDGFKAGVIFTIIIVFIIGIIIWAVRMVAHQVSKKYTLQTVPVKVKHPIREV